MLRTARQGQASEDSPENRIEKDSSLAKGESKWQSSPNFAEFKLENNFRDLNGIFVFNFELFLIMNE